MTAPPAFLKTPADIAAWPKAIATLHGEPIQHLAYQAEPQALLLDTVQPIKERETL